MPRLTTLRVGALEDLARQLRFAPRAAVVRHIRAAEAIGAELEPDRAYPLTWLVQSLTGYRADEPKDAGDVVIVGAALRADLSALVERLSHQAALSLDDFDDETIALDELCARWGVHRKTIERRRRDGLVGRRVRSPEGRARLVFARDVIERFERERRAPPARPLVRLSPDERAGIVRRAILYRRRLGWSPEQVAERLAQRTGRSRATIRRTLRAHDEASDRPIFSTHPALSERDRRAALRARRRGLGFAPIAAGFGWTVPTAQRAVHEARAALLRTIDLDAPTSPVFERADARDVLLAPSAVREGLGAPVALDAAAALARAAGQARPAEAIDRRRAAAACYLRWSARRRLAALAPVSPRARALDEIETDLRWCALLIIEVVRAHEGLALRTIEDLLGASPLDLSADDVRDVHRRAMGALAHAAWTFDPFLASGRFAGHAAGHLTRALARPVAEARARLGGSARRSHQRSIELDDWTERIAPWRAWLGPTGAMIRFVRESPPDDGHARVAALRFGLARPGQPPMTCAGVAARLGVGAGAVAAMEAGAHRRALGLGPEPRIDPERSAQRSLRRRKVR